MDHVCQHRLTKVTIEQETYYVSLYIFNQGILNMQVFRNVDNSYQSVLPETLKAAHRKEMLLRIRAGEDEQVSVEELASVHKHLTERFTKESIDLKKIISNSTKEVTLDYVGEVAGYPYAVLCHANGFYSEMVWWSVTDKGDLTFSPIPDEFVDLIILDYFHRKHIGIKSVFLLLSENLFIGLKASAKRNRFFHVVHIDVTEDQVSAKKAFIVQKEGHSFAPISFHAVTEQGVQELQRDGKQIIHTFINKMNLTTV